MQFPDHLQRHLERGVALRDAGRYRGRFAPSPTGVLHLGNLQTALLSWLAARQLGGDWLLRIDDLDTPRNRSGAIEAIQMDLTWLGLNWDGPVILQSQRRGIYASWLSWLRRSGKLFACRCSRRELTGQPIYPGTCRRAERGWGWKQKRLPSWRLQVPAADRFGSGDVVCAVPMASLPTNWPPSWMSSVSASPMWCVVRICVRLSQPSAVFLQLLSSHPLASTTAHCSAMAMA